MYVYVFEVFGLEKVIIVILLGWVGFFVFFFSYFFFWFVDKVSEVGMVKLMVVFVGIFLIFVVVKILFIVFFGIFFVFFGFQSFRFIFRKVFVSYYCFFLVIGGVNGVQNLLIFIGGVFFWFCVFNRRNLYWGYFEWGVFGIYVGFVGFFNLGC